MKTKQRPFSGTGAWLPVLRTMSMKSARSFFVGILVLALGFLLALLLPYSPFSPLNSAKAEETAPSYIEPSYMGDSLVNEETDLGCFIWQETAESAHANSYWHLVLVNKGGKTDLHFNGSIAIEGEDPRFTFHRLTSSDKESKDRVAVSKDKNRLYLDLQIDDSDFRDELIFLFSGDDIAFTIRLNGEFEKDLIFIGGERLAPEADRNPVSLSYEPRYFISDFESPSEGIVGLELPSPIQVNVTDEMGNFAPGQVPVFAEVGLATGNSFIISEETDATGRVAIQFTLEEKAGMNTVRLFIYSNDQTLKFIIVSRAGDPEFINVPGPFLHFGVVGGELADPLRVEVWDQFQNPVIGEEVRFEVLGSGEIGTADTSGGNSDDDPSAVTEWKSSIVVDSAGDGSAEVFYRLPVLPGANQLKVSLENYGPAEIGSVFFTIVGSDDTDTDGIPDKVDDDIDGDNVTNFRDAFPYNPEASEDNDEDGFPDQWNPGYDDARVAAMVPKSNLSGLVDNDRDGDGFLDTTEIASGFLDYKRNSMYQGAPYVYDIRFDPKKDEMTEFDIMTVDLYIISSGNLTGVEIFYSTFTEKGDAVMKSISHEEANIELSTKKATNVTNVTFYSIEGTRIAVDPILLPSSHQAEDDLTLGVVQAYRYEFDHYSTGENVEFSFTLKYVNENGTSFPMVYPGEDEIISFRISSSANIIGTDVESFAYLLLPVMAIGFFAVWRLKRKLATVRFRDVKWTDVHLKEVFFTVKKIFGDVREVKNLLREGTGKLIRLVYFLGVTGSLLLAAELLYGPKDFMVFSAVYIGFTLLITILSPVIYVYFTRWKYKSPTVGKMRLFFLITFPVATVIAISSGQNELAYTLIFFFMFLIPLLMYANLIGSNWNFLVFNAHKETWYGFDYLTNRKVSFAARIGAFGFFLNVLLMPLFSLNSIHGAYVGKYEDGGVLGERIIQLFEVYGDDTIILVLSRFVAIFIVLNVVIIGIAMVFRVIQLQFYSSQKFAGRFGLGYRNYHGLKDDATEQRRLIGFCFFVFFGYSVVLLLLTIYANFAYLLPILPYLSRDILDDLSYRLSLAHNIAFLVFWMLSVTKIKTVWRMKGYFDGFVIRFKK